jgi:putative SOS response-associated peptidase YedK
MCGRIAQTSPFHDYVETIRWNPRAVLDAPVGKRFNIPPGTHPAVLHRLDGIEAMARLHWGYKPVWLKRAPVSNARLDTINDPSKSFWRGPFQHGRLIVPANGWFEWTGEKGDKQPWYIHGADGAPLLFAAVSAWRPGAEPDAEHGMAIVTDDSAGGMVDIHDRRPVALTAEQARAWADPATPTALAREILAAALPEEAYQWHPVRKEVGNSRYEMPDAIDPV